MLNRIYKIKDKLFLHQKKVCITLFCAGIAAIAAYMLLLYLLQCMPKKVQLDNWSGEGAPVRFDIASLSVDSQEIGIQHLGRRNYIVVEETGLNGQFISARGWAIIPGEKINTATSSFILYDETTHTYWGMRTRVEQRPDLAEYFENDTLNYQYGGMIGIVKTSFLPKDRTYQLYIAYSNNGHQILVNTDESVTIREDGSLEYA